MADSKGGSEGPGTQKLKRRKKKNPEEHFGSEVDIKIKGLINPAETADLPAGPPLKASHGHSRVQKDATQAESIKELETKLKEVVANGASSVTGAGTSTSASILAGAGAVGAAARASTTANGSNTGPTSDAVDNVGRKMATKFLAQVDIKESDESNRKQSTGSAKTKENAETQQKEPSPSDPASGSGPGEPSKKKSSNGGGEQPPPPGSAKGEGGGGSGGSSLAKRILVLSQKGDWASCENSLKALEKQAADEGGSKPLADIADTVTGNTPLMYAAMENKTLIIERMIDLGCDIHAKNKEQYTTLHLASMYSREETIKLLLNKKADPAAPGGPKNQSCVHLVCSRPTSQALQILRTLTTVAPKSTRTQPDVDGNIPLFAAIEAGNFNVCRELLTQDTETQIKYTKPPLNDTVLHLAARRKDNDLVKLFIEAGAGVDVKNDEGQTCLHIASLNGDENMTRTLYLARANASVTDNEDRTPMHLAAERGHTSTVEFLADKFKASVFDRTKDGSTLMHIAALNGHPDTAMVLFKKGVPLLMPNKNGARGIHTAAMKGHVAVINTMLSKGENVDAVTNENYAALHLAVEAGKSAVVEALLGHGAQVHIKGGVIGETPLHIAARIEESRGEKCTKMLLKSGADTNMAMADGRTPLHISSESGTIAVLRQLLSNGADPVRVDNSGETALHKACRRCHYPVVKELLDYLKQSKGETIGFVKLVNDMGESALHYAARIKKMDLHFPQEDSMVIQLLMENGSDVFMQTKNEKETVFHYCAKEGNVDVLKAILAGLHSGQIQLAVNKQSKDGWSPLIVAASRGHVDAVKIFLENNGRVDVFDLEGRSALHLAAEFGSIEVCEALLNKNAFVNSKSKTGWTSLHYAAMKGYTTLVEFLIKKHNATIDSLTMPKKQTPLHLAASAGQESVCTLLIDLGASLDATDDYGQKPIHLAAQSNKATVVKILLKQRPNLVSVATKDGSTCAHIAASKGSVSVIEELMKFDKNVVISSRNKLTDSTPLHIATEGGHFEIVKLLLDAGAQAADENKMGFTPIHIAAKFGHSSLIDKFAKTNVNVRQISRKTGMSALHIAAYYGEEDAVRELLTHIPASIKSEAPASPAHALTADLASESDLTPLHMAAFSGSEAVVRALLNSQGVQVEGGCSPSGYIPLHLASLRGHVGVVGLLLSRSTTLLKLADQKGQTCLHVAASSGHYEMVQILLGQGSDYTSVDKSGWTPLHCAAQAGHLNVVKLLVESGAPTTAQTTNGRIPLWFAAAENNLAVVMYLLKQSHDAYNLLEDRKFVYNLMACGKKSANAPTEEFILESPAPVDVSAKLSAIYRELSLKEKDRAHDLVEASKFAEAMCNELVTIASVQENPGTILQSTDRRSVPFLDILIECEQKQVIANSAVQTYTTELWKGGISHWSGTKIFSFLAMLSVFPPLWVIFSLPLENKYNKTPIVKFGCHLTSHVFFMTFHILTSCMPIYPIYGRNTLFPYWNEWVLVIWLSGLLLGEITSPGDRTGLGAIKIVIIILNLIAFGIHVTAIFMDDSYWPVLIYIRNIFGGFSFLCCCIQILDFLSFHHLFGPWAIIISSLIIDTGKFLTVLMLFEVGFSMLIVAMNQAYYAQAQLSEEINKILNENEGYVPNPLDALERLFFALFGLTTVADLKMSEHIEDWTLELFKFVYAIYLLTTSIVLINLLIAMMSDTYQRIQQDSDTEWKFGLAKLIRNMHRTNASPAPINLITTWTTYIGQYCKKKRKNDKYKRMKQDDGKKGGSKMKGKVTPFTEALSTTDVGGQTAAGSMSSVRSKNFLENSVDWKPVVKKYRSLIDNTPGDDDDD